MFCQTTGQSFLTSRTLWPGPPRRRHPSHPGAAAFPGGPGRCRPPGPPSGTLDPRSPRPFSAAAPGPNAGPCAGPRARAGLPVRPRPRGHADGRQHTGRSRGPPITAGRPHRGRPGRRSMIGNARRRPLGRAGRSAMGTSWTRQADGADPSDARRTSTVRPGWALTSRERPTGGRAGLRSSTGSCGSRRCLCFDQFPRPVNPSPGRIRLHRKIDQRSSKAAGRRVQAIARALRHSVAPRSA